MARLSLAPLLVCLTLLITGCGTRAAATIRIGVVADCEGAYAFERDSSYAGGELPLIQRGARALGVSPASGITSVRIAGKRIQVLLGCGDGTAQTAVTEARRLVEQERAEVLIGPTQDNESLAVKEYARRRPGITFLDGSGTVQSLTLDDPVANFFRFTPDAAQWAAGLAAYAYHTLGWRTAETVGLDQPATYTQVAGFVSEFCALGGRIAHRYFSSSEDLSARAESGEAGFFVVDPISFTNELAGVRGNLAKRIVGGTAWAPAGNPFISPLLEKQLAGVVIAGPIPARSRRPAWKHYLAAMERFFPDANAQTFFAIGYYDAMAAVLQALERVHGDLSNGQRRFRSALSAVELNSPVGMLRLDARRQAVAPNYLSQFRPSHGGLVEYAADGAIAPVDETFGGEFAVGAPAPSRTYPPCRRTTAPPWDRSG